MDLSVLMQAIGIIGRSTIKTEAQIQHVAVQCIAQSIVHRNATPAKELYDNLPKGFRHDSLAAYFEKFGNLAFKDKSIVFFDCEKTPNGKKLEWTPVYEISVEAMHWTNGTKKPVPKSVYDADEEIGKVLERLVKLASDSTKTMKNKELLERVVATYNAYSMEQGVGGQTAEEIAGEVIHATDFNNSMAAIRELTAAAETAALILANAEETKAA